MSSLEWMGFAVGLSLLLALGLALRELLRVLRAQAPLQVRQQLIGADAQPSRARIPKIIWTYWNEDQPPPLIQQCLANWQRVAPDHELRLLKRSTLERWFPASALGACFDDLPAYRQADWLRIQLLARHGGIWMDASTLLSQNLDWVHQAQQAQQSEFVGFYIDRYSNRPELPLIENWFLAAVPGSGFAKAWAQALDHALQIGAESLLQSLQDQGRFERVVQDLTPDFQRYLLMHVAVADLLDREPQRFRLALLRAEDSAYALHAALGWRKRHLYARLALTPCPARLPALIKLRGPDRRVLEQGLARRPVLPSSALAQLMPTSPP